MTKPLFARFNQEQVSSDGGAILLKAAERVYGLVKAFAGCLFDKRAPDKASLGACVCPFAIEGVLVVLLLPVSGWGTASRTASGTCSTGVVSARICVHLHPKTPINTVFTGDLGDLRTGSL